MKHNINYYDMSIGTSLKFTSSAMLIPNTIPSSSPEDRFVPVRGNNGQFQVTSISLKVIINYISTMSVDSLLMAINFILRAQSLRGAGGTPTRTRTRADLGTRLKERALRNQYCTLAQCVLLATLVEA